MNDKFDKFPHIKLKEEFPHIISGDEKYWQVACRKCGRTDWHLFSRGEGDFMVMCINCLHTQALHPSNMVDKTD